MQQTDIRKGILSNVGMRIDGIQSLREKCPLETKRFDGANVNDLNAHDLFNKFTADIIKTNIVFTR